LDLAAVSMSGNTDDNNSSFAWWIYVGNLAMCTGAVQGLSSADEQEQQ
jgi:hypothetical protein